MFHPEKQLIVLKRLKNMMKLKLVFLQNGIV